MKKLFPPTTIIGCRAAGRGLLLVALILTGCRDAREQALVELERRNIAANSAALETAVRQGDQLIIGFLSIAGVKAAQPAVGEPSILHLAAARRDWPLVQQLLPFSDAPLLNHPGPSQQGVLEQAVLAGEFALARKLVAAGARPEPAACGVDALVQGSAADPLLMDELLNCLPTGHAALTPALLRAVRAGESERAQRLLAQGASPGAIAADGQGTALELACQAGNLPIAEALLKSGAKPADSPHALSLAVERKDASLVQLLLEAGASPNTPADPSQPDSTPLAAALSASALELTSLMLSHGAAPERCMEFALTKGDTGLLDLMQQKGMPLDQPGPDGNPPLVRAAAAGQTEVVRKLLEKGVPLDAPGVLGQTAFHMAVIHQKTEVTDLLLAAGCKPDAPFVKPAPAGLLPLFDSEYFVKWYKRDLNLTPLMLAAARGDVAQLRQLLKAGAKRGAQTREWHRYPIIFACDNAHIGAAQLLLGRNPEDEIEKRHAIISLSRQRVTLYKNDQAVRTAKVSTGKKSTPTPTGKFVITDKQPDWVSTIYKVPMPFFMRLSCKEIGLHAGVVPGYPASHGCIRMPRGEVQAFYKLLRIGDPVTIEP